MNIADMALRNRRDGLLREVEHLRKRIERISDEIIALNQRVLPTFPIARCSDD